MTSESLNPIEPEKRDHPLFHLPREDLDLVAELVLQSGSLKGLAESYGVSYPTIRARLDRVIGRLRAAVDGRVPDPMTELLARLVERGEMTPAAARQLRDHVREVSTGRHKEAPPGNGSGDGGGSGG